MPLLRTLARLDDAGRRHCSMDAGSPRCAARYVVNMTDPRIQDVVSGRPVPAFDGLSLTDSVRRHGSTWIVVVDPPTVRAARYGFDTTDARHTAHAIVGDR